MAIRPSASCSDATMRASACAGLAMPPPNDPECTSFAAPRTMISEYVSPRSPMHSEGMPRPYIAVSETQT
jgi:hypothetical protein